MMKNIIFNLKALFGVAHGKGNLPDCNYSNNYYGDQVCQSK